MKKKEKEFAKSPAKNPDDAQQKINKHTKGNLERVTVKNIARRVLHEIDSNEDASAGGRLVAEALTEYSKDVEKGSVYEKCFSMLSQLYTDAEDLRGSWCVFLRQNFYQNMKNHSEVIKDLTEEKHSSLFTRDFLLEKSRCQLVIDFLDHITAQERYFTAMADLMRKMLPEFKEIKGQAAQRKAELTQQAQNIHEQEIETIQEDNESSQSVSQSPSHTQAAPNQQPQHGQQSPQHSRSRFFSLVQPNIASGIQANRRASVSILQKKKKKKTHFKRGSSPIELPPLQLTALVPQDNPIFGIPLEKALDMHPDIKVPKLIYEAVRQLDSSGLTQVGLFRISGARKRVKELMDGFDAGNPISFRGEQDHVICTIFKTYLRTLPSPLVPFEKVGDFLDVPSKVPTEERVGKLKDLIGQLSSDRVTCLEFIVSFANRIAAKSDINQMTVTNLASLLAPNILFRNDSDNLSTTVEGNQLMEDSQNAINVFEIFMKHDQILFDKAIKQKPGEPETEQERAEFLAHTIKQASLYIERFGPNDLTKLFITENSASSSSSSAQTEIPSADLVKRTIEGLKTVHYQLLDLPLSPILMVSVLQQCLSDLKFKWEIQNNFVQIPIDEQIMALCDCLQKMSVSETSILESITSLIRSRISQILSATSSSPLPYFSALLNAPTLLPPPTNDTSSDASSNEVGTQIVSKILEILVMHEDFVSKFKQLSVVPKRTPPKKKKVLVSFSDKLKQTGEDSNQSNQQQNITEQITQDQQTPDEPSHKREKSIESATVIRNPITTTNTTTTTDTNTVTTTTTPTTTTTETTTPTTTATHTITSTDTATPTTTTTTTSTTITTTTTTTATATDTTTTSTTLTSTQTTDAPVKVEKENDKDKIGEDIDVEELQSLCDNSDEEDEDSDSDSNDNTTSTNTNNNEKVKSDSDLMSLPFRERLKLFRSIETGKKTDGSSHNAELIKKLDDIEKKIKVATKVLNKLITSKQSIRDHLANNTSPTQPNTTFGALPLSAFASPRIQQQQPQPRDRLQNQQQRMSKSFEFWLKIEKSEAVSKEGLSQQN